MLYSIIEYTYRDGSNCKRRVEVAVAGTFTAEDRKKIKQVLDYETFGEGDGRGHFIPSQVELPDLQAEFDGGIIPDVDHVWHEWDWACISHGEDLITPDTRVMPMTAQELASHFADTKGKWDVSAAMTRNRIAIDSLPLDYVSQRAGEPSPGFYATRACQDCGQ